MPWGFVGNTGWMMHSIISTVENQGGFVAGIGPGYTNKTCGDPNDTYHYPITAEFLNIEYDQSGALNSGNYRMNHAGGGERSSLNVAGGIAVPSNPTTDSRVYRSCGWYGDLNIRNSTNAAELATECQTPSNPTMNAGTSPSFNHDYGHWAMTADATLKVDFTLTHQWTSPILCISGWNGSVPSVSINGVTQTVNVNYVYSTNDGSGDACSTDASHLLLQVVGLPTNGSGGMTALSSSTRIIIKPAGSPPPVGVPHLGRQTIFIKSDNH
jgi:hypothetical protein